MTFLLIHSWKHSPHHTVFLMTEGIHISSLVNNHFWRVSHLTKTFCEAGSLLAYTNRMSRSAKIRFRITRSWKNIVLNNCDEGPPSCAILQYMYNYYNMHYSLSVHQYNTLGESFSYIKWIVWAVLYFCNCVTMQGSNNVSNLVLWARNKSWGGIEATSEICLFYKDARCSRWFNQVKKWALIVMVTNQWWDNVRYSREKKYISSSISERYLDMLFLDERDASVDCVIVLYDWKLIIYSLVPTRLRLLCLPCYYCYNTLNKMLQHYGTKVYLAPCWEFDEKTSFTI